MGRVLRPVAGRRFIRSARGRCISRKEEAAPRGEILLPPGVPLLRREHGRDGQLRDLRQLVPLRLRRHLSYRIRALRARRERALRVRGLRGPAGAGGASSTGAAPCGTPRGTGRAASTTSTARRDGRAGRSRRRRPGRRGTTKPGRERASSGSPADQLISLSRAASAVRAAPTHRPLARLVASAASPEARRNRPSCGHGASPGARGREACARPQSARASRGGTQEADVEHSWPLGTSSRSGRRSTSPRPSRPHASAAAASTARTILTRRRTSTAQGVQLRARRCSDGAGPTRVEIQNFRTAVLRRIVALAAPHDDDDEARRRRLASATPAARDRRVPRHVQKAQARPGWGASRAAARRLSSEGRLEARDAERAERREPRAELDQAPRDVVVRVRHVQINERRSSAPDEEHSDGQRDPAPGVEAPQSRHGARGPVATVGRGTATYRCPTFEANDGGGGRLVAVCADRPLPVRVLVPVEMPSTVALSSKTHVREPHPTAGVDGESCLQSLVPWAGVWPFGRRQACRMKTAQRGKRRYCVMYKQNLAHVHVVAAVGPNKLQPLRRRPGCARRSLGW